MEPVFVPLVFYSLLSLYLLYTGYILITRSTKSPFLLFLGISACIIGAICIIALYFDQDIWLFVILPALYLYLAFSCAPLLKSVKEARSLKFIGALNSSLLVLFTALIASSLYYEYKEGTLIHHYGNCSFAVDKISRTQESYFAQYGAYAETLEELFTHAETRCIGRETNCMLSSGNDFLLLMRSCRNIDLSVMPDGGFRIEAITKGMPDCYICATHNGMNRRNYRDCYHPEYDDCL